MAPQWNPGVSGTRLLGLKLVQFNFRTSVVLTILDSVPVSMISNIPFKLQESLILPNSLPGNRTIRMIADENWTPEIFIKTMKNLNNRFSKGMEILRVILPEIYPVKGVFPAWQCFWESFWRDALHNYVSHLVR